MFYSNLINYLESKLKDFIFFLLDFIFRKSINYVRKKNHFNSLPPEIIEFIFKKLNLDDLINLRIVDRRFKEICKQIKIKQLIVCDYQLPTNYSKFWFYTNNPNYFNEINTIKISKLLSYKSIFKLDTNLKRLSIFTVDDYITFLNDFKQLEELKISANKFSGLNKLTLENLKILEIFISYHCSFKLILDTSKLFAFKTNFSLDQFFFNYPGMILFYETRFNHYDNKIDNFQNLQYLKLIGTFQSIDRNLLFRFNSLAILDLQTYQYINQDSFDYLKDDIQFIFAQRESLQRFDLEIYLNGIKLTDQNKNQLFNWSSYRDEIHHLELYINNYDLLKENCYDKDKINYSDLIKLIGIIPSSFANKFQNINHVYADDYINDKDQFIKFLSCLPYLFRLECNNCRLTKSFYDKLINLVYLNNLEYLTLNDKVDLKLNFNFILNLKKLKEFKTNLQIANYIDLISKLLTNNKNITVFHSKLDDKKLIEINGKHNNNFNVKFINYLDYDPSKINRLSYLSVNELILKLKNF